MAAALLVSPWGHEWQGILSLWRVTETCSCLGAFAETEGSPQGLSSLDDQLRTLK